MLTFGYFTKFPSAYKDREESAKNVIFTNIKPIIKDNKIIIYGKTDKYEQEVEIQDDVIHLNSPVKVFCSCESFKYEFANSIFRAGSLLKPIDFIRSIISRPKHKNVHNIPSGCKHLVALSRQIIKIKIKRGT